MGGRHPPIHRCQNQSLQGAGEGTDAIGLMEKYLFCIFLHSPQARMANTVMGLGGNMVIWQLLGIALIVTPNHNLGPLDIRFLDLLSKETLLSLSPSFTSNCA